MRPARFRAHVATRFLRALACVPRSTSRVLFGVAAGVMCVAAVDVGAAGVDDGSIGLYADLTGTQTQATFSIGVPRTLYLLGRLEGRTSTGITGAEFRVTGFPADWQVFLTPNPAAVIVLGNPFREQAGVHRANIVFSGCQPGVQGRVLLYTAVVIATSPSAPPVFVVEAGNPPANPGVPFPLLNLCDSPNFTKVPVAGDSFQVYTRAPQDLDYSPLPGYDNARGVQPVRGFPGDVFHFRVVYSNADGLPPLAGSPRLELDANGDGDALDPGEGSFSMAPADQDSTLSNGKEYRYDVALGEPPGGRYRYRFAATTGAGTPVPGAATAWVDSLFVSGDIVDLVVRSEGIRILPAAPDVNSVAAIVARIENPSAQRVENVVVRVENVFRQVIAERTLASLGPRSTTEIACTWRFMDIAFQPVVVRVDPANTIAERDESNNVASRAVFVGVPVASGRILFTGLPPLVTVPPLAPFLLEGHADYSLGVLPQTPVSGARVTIRPSWESPRTIRTDAAGDFQSFVVPPSGPGTYGLVFVVTDGARTDSAQVNLSVAATGATPHMPNLVMQLGVAPNANCPADAAQITWSVENRGDVGSAPTTVRLLADGVAPAAEVAVEAIAPGATSVLSPIMVPLGGPGLRSFTAHADPGSAVREMREDDNAATASLVVAPECLDLALASVRYTGSRFCTDASVDLAVGISNRGCVASSAARISMRSQGTEIASAPLAALGGGQSVEVAFTPALPLGCTNLDFVLDPEGAAGADCDTQSDALTSFACIAVCTPLPPPAPPDFQVLPCDVAVSNARPNLGEPLRFTAWISNVGQGDGEPVFVRFLVDGVVVGGGAVGVGTIPHGGRVLAVSPGTWPADFAPHILTVSVDGNDSNGGNNEASRTLPWNLRAKPIASCPPASPSMFSTCTPCVDVPLDIRAVVENDGLFDCASVDVDFRDPLHGGAFLGRATALDVRGGNTCTTAPAPVSITHAFTVAGLHSIAAVVDPDDAWPEVNESDNIYVRDVTLGCAAAPDLVAAVRLPAGFTPQPGDTVRAVEVEVRNQGAAPASNVQARLELDGTTLCNLEMGNLPPNQSNTVVCTTPWIVAADHCSQRLEACADPDGLIGESNEGNNCAVTGVTSSGSTDLAIYPWDLRVTPTNPSIGQQVLIEVGMHNWGGVESTCLLTAEWSLDYALWLPIAIVPLRLPAGILHLPNAATFNWTVPSPTLFLRFRLANICPMDLNPNNNVAEGTLPWFTPPATPVVVSDFATVSTPEGVRVRWRAEPVVAAFVLERRRQGDRFSVRLPDVIPAIPGSDLESFEVLDRDAEPGARLDYTLLARWADGREEILRTLSLVHDAATALAPVQLHPVRPNPFRPGDRIEFSLAKARDVELCIFDITGRRVVQLRRGTESAGRHAVTWDGRDESGRRAPAGVYFCRLVAQSSQQNRRLVLVH